MKQVFLRFVDYTFKCKYGNAIMVPAALLISFVLAAVIVFMIKFPFVFGFACGIACTKVYKYVLNALKNVTKEFIAAIKYAFAG